MIDLRYISSFFPDSIRKNPDMKKHILKEYIQLMTLNDMTSHELIARAKGRDFYDAMFLLAQTQPDYSFLQARAGIGSLEQLKSTAETFLHSIDLETKKRDFAHLLFDSRQADKILRFPDFINNL